MIDNALDPRTQAEILKLVCRYSKRGEAIPEFVHYTLTRKRNVEVTIESVADYMESLFKQHEALRIQRNESFSYYTHIIED